MEESEDQKSKAFDLFKKYFFILLDVAQHKKIPFGIKDIDFIFDNLNTEEEAFEPVKELMKRYLREYSFIYTCTK